MPNPAREAPAYRIETAVYSGPLDLLLHLIEREELDITAISLALVTEQYLQQVDAMQLVEGEQKIVQLIDFLDVGARLVLIKSRALLPRPPVALVEGEEEEDPAAALLRQLRQYRRFKEAAQWLGKREAAGLRTYLRVAPPPRVAAAPDLSDVTLAGLRAMLQAVLDRSETREESVDVVQPRRITIEAQLHHVRETLRRQPQIEFRELLSRRADRVEVAVTLLAMLELIKRREVIAFQEVMFGPILVKAGAKESAAAAEPAG
jgi:segregation and condensation protein A